VPTNRAGTPDACYLECLGRFAKGYFGLCLNGYFRGLGRFRWLPDVSYNPLVGVSLAGSGKFSVETGYRAGNATVNAARLDAARNKKARSSRAGLLNFAKTFAQTGGANRLAASTFTPGPMVEEIATRLM
jgi:hypothetical protein